MKRRLALAVVGIAAVTYQVAASRSLIDDVLLGHGLLRAPFRLHPGTPMVLQPNHVAAAAGLQQGDTIIELNGAVLDGMNDVRRAVANEEPMKIRWLHNGEMRFGTIPLERLAPTELTNALVVIVTTILTPMVCLIIGFGVAAIRPRDGNAWILLLLMLGFSQMTSPRQMPVGASWPLPLAAAAAGWPSLWSSLWGLAMALFGISFPKRLAFDRRHPWVKGLLIVPSVFVSVCLFLLVAGDAERFGLLPGLGEFFRRSGWTGFWLNSIGIAIFFASFGYRLGTEKDPDAKRRLRIIYWGAQVSLLPIFLVFIAGRILNQDPFTHFPGWLMVPVLLLLFIFPASLAYAIVVHRAMDVRVVVRQGLQYAMARRGLVATRVILMLLALWWAATIVLDPNSRSPVRLQAIALVMIVASWSHIAMEKAGHWVDRRFFRGAVDTERVLTQLGDSVRSIVETKPLLERVAHVVSDTLHVDQVMMFLDAGDRLEPAYAVGGGNPTVDGVASIGDAMRRKREPIRLQGGERLALPLATKDKLIGVMLLGPKKSEEPYSGSDIRLLQSVAGQTGLAIENSQLTEAVAHEVAARERLNRELEIAREVQQKLFPQQLPVVPGIQYAGKCRPAQSVGGDYFDFIELPDGGLGLAVGDVSGKGIPAALLMASLQACLRGQIMDGASDLSKLMRNINRLIFDASPVNRYATFFYGQYCQSSGHFLYVNAGHNPPFLLRNEKAIPLEDGGPVIGLFQNAQYKQGEVAIQPGDIFLGYTDGVSEAMNAADEEWGEPNLIEETQGCRGLEPREMIDCLIAGADRFANGAPQHDDMTLIIAKFC